MNTKGYTFIELVVAMGVIAVLFSIATTSLFQIQYRTNTSGLVTTFIADVRAQQLRAMSGSTDGESQPDAYGVYVSSNQYVLFKGNTYVPGNSSNRIITLEYPSEFTSILLTDSSLVFASGSGNLTGYDTNNHSLSISNTAQNEIQTIDFNSLGVPISVTKL